MKMLTMKNKENKPKNPEMFNLAKDEGEPVFIEVIKASGQFIPVFVEQAFGDDDQIYHYDVKIFENYDERDGAYEWHYVDVKDVEKGNFHTGNYSLNDKFLDFHNDYKSHNYYTAFRLVENNKRSRKFIVVNTQEMLQNCNLKKIKTNYLISLNDVKAKCKYRLIKEDF